MDLREYDKVLILNFLEEFKCESCTLCCTKKWNINLTLKEYLETKEKMTSIGKDMDEYVEYVDSAKGFITKFKGTNCSFLQEDKNCFLQKNFGWEILSETCRVFPRKMTLSPRGLEISLGLSCPSVTKYFFDKKPTTIVVKEKGEIRFMDPKSFSFIDPGNAPEGSFLNNYFDFEGKAIDIFNNQSENLGKLLNDLLILFNNYNGLETVALPKNNDNMKINVEFLKRLFLCSHKSQGFSLEKTNELLKQFINLEKFPTKEEPELYMTEELLTDIFSHWDKEDDSFLKKYCQGLIFNKSIFINHKLGVVNLIYMILIIKFYLALNAKVRGRKLTQDEKVKIIVETSTPLAHNKALEGSVTQMILEYYKANPDVLFQMVSTCF